MKKLHIMLVVLCIFSLFLASVAFAGGMSREETLDAAYEHLVKVMEPEKLNELFSLFDTMKDVGLSWNEDLLIDFENVVACKTKEQLHVLWGIGGMNYAYSVLFEKSPEGIVEFVMDINERIGLPSPELRGGSTTISKSREGQPKRSADFLHAMLNRAKTDDAVLNTLVGGFYGSTIELFHLFSSLGLAAGITDEYIAFLNKHLPRLAIAQEMLDAYSKSAELANLLDTENRRAVVDSIVGIIERDMGKLTENDLKEILAITKVVRDPLVAPCN